MSDSSAFLVMMGVLVILFAIATALTALQRQVTKLPPYRKVVWREDTPEGEHVELECGHCVLIKRHRRNDFPCEQCKGEKHA